MRKTETNNVWKAGLFYYNKQDHRVFPPKRIPALGWTVNFANPYSIMAFVLLILVVLSVGYFVANIRNM